MTIFTGIFGFYDILKKPQVITPGWNYVCYTDQDFASEIWEVRKVALIDNNPVLTARYYKIMFHEHIDDEFSIWIDGSFTINTDLDKFMAGNFKSPMTVVKHPVRNCIYREADECIRQKRGDWKVIEKQVEAYRSVVPKNAGLIQSGILMRQNIDLVRRNCIDWYKQVEMWSTRDQIAFTYVAAFFGWPHVTVFDYRTSMEFLFKKHLHAQPHRIN